MEVLLEPRDQLWGRAVRTTVRRSSRVQPIGSSEMAVTWVVLPALLDRPLKPQG